MQLPFLQAVLEDFELVPIVVGGAEAAVVAQVRGVSADEVGKKTYENAQRLFG